MKHTFLKRTFSPLSSKAVGLSVILGVSAFSASPASAALAGISAPSDKVSLLEVVGVSGLTPDTLPEPTERAQPAYPYRAIEDGREGWVIVKAEVDASGKPLNAEVVETSGGLYFNRSALQALKKFKFKPATLEGKAVAVSNVRYKFTYTLVDG